MQAKRRKEPNSSLQKDPSASRHAETDLHQNSEAQRTLLGRCGTRVDVGYGAGAFTFLAMGGAPRMRRASSAELVMLKSEFRANQALTALSRQLVSQSTDLQRPPDTSLLLTYTPCEGHRPSQLRVRFAC